MFWVFFSEAIVKTNNYIQNTNLLHTTEQDSLYDTYLEMNENFSLEQLQLLHEKLSPPKYRTWNTI